MNTVLSTGKKIIPLVVFEELLSCEITLEMATSVMD